MDKYKAQRDQRNREAIQSHKEFIHNAPIDFSIVNKKFKNGLDLAESKWLSPTNKWDVRIEEIKHRYEFKQNFEDR